MTEFSIYLIISTVCLSFSYGIFKITFRDESKFGHQRIFLLASLVFSVLLPASGIRFEIPALHPVDVSQGNYTLTGISSINIIPEDTGFLRSAIEYVPYIYIIVSAFLILLMISQLVKILRLRIISKKIRIANLLILRSKKIKSPFSFFSWVFIPENITEKEEIDSIIIHENIHARNYHSIDNIISGLATALMWFNPVLWLLKSSLQLVHEYLADEGTLSAGIEKTHYQVLLLNQAAEARLICIPSTFNNDLKKRMIMMKKSSNQVQSRFRILTLLPVSMFLFIVVAVLNGLFIVDVNASDVNQKQKHKAKKNRSEEITVVGYATKPDTINYIVDGVSMNSIDGIPADSIESVNVLKTDRTIIVRTKSFDRKHVPESQNTVKTGAPKMDFNIRQTSTISDNVLYILDGKTISKDEIHNIDPSGIKSIDVIKGKERIKKYTDKGYDGVILITTK